MTEEFSHLQRLLQNKKAIIGFNKFFIRKTLMLYLDLKNEIVFWILGVFSFLTSEWVLIPVSIFLAWRLHDWWLVFFGIASCWIIDEIIKTVAMDVVRNGISKDERAFKYLWSLQPFHITLSSTKMQGKESKVFIYPPQDWGAEIEARVDDFE